VTRLPYLDVQRAGLSGTATCGPARPPSRLIPRGSKVRIGWVDSGQSIVRPTTTASLLVFHRTRVQASAICGAANMRPAAAAATIAILKSRIDLAVGSCFGMLGLPFRGPYRCRLRALAAASAAAILSARVL